MQQREEEENKPANELATEKLRYQQGKKI